MHEIMKLVDLCRDKTVYIQTHNFPDPDAIASAYGLQKLFEKENISSKICYEGRIDKLSAMKMLETFGVEMYSYNQLQSQMKETDYIICVDSQKHAGNIKDFIGNEVASIDHHPTFVDVEYLYSDIRITGACSSLIAEYYQRLGYIPDCDTATALLYGIKMDTLQFTRGVTLLDIKMFEFLHPLCDQEKMLRMERNNMEFADLKAYGAAIDSIKVYGREGICFIPFSCPDGLLGAVSDFILSLEEVDVAIVSAVRADGIKISVRSETAKVHAGKLIKKALENVGDGGGHANMAGGLISIENVGLLGDLPEHRIKSLFFDAMEEMLKERR